MKKESYDVVIIGGAIIGLSTASFAARAGLALCVVEKV
jgi:glycine/D-amino acid oxidase-like deaminating enzyme